VTGDGASLVFLLSLYRAAVSALLSLVVLLIMLCEIACRTFTTVWANKEGRKEDYGCLEWYW